VTCYILSPYYICQVWKNASFLCFVNKFYKKLLSRTDIFCNIIILYTRLLTFDTDKKLISEKLSFLLSELLEQLLMCLKADLFVANNVFSC